jgi:predicted amidohydrolase YtcJ
MHKSWSNIWHKRRPDGAALELGGRNMQPLRLRWLLSLILGACTLHCGAQTLIIGNVNGYTPIGTRMQAFTGLVVRDGKVERLITAKQSLPKLPNATTLDGKGATLLPGLIDAHGHVLTLGEQRLQVGLRGTTSVEAALQRVRTFAAANREGWVIGNGWNQVLWPSRQFPTAAQLDTVVADRPALLNRVDGHAIWVNSAALKLAGITQDTPDPSGGQIIRDAQGKPTGVLVDAATSLVEKRVPTPTEAQLARALSTAMSELAALGLTGVHDAGIDMRQYAAYQQLGAAGELPVRVYAMLADKPEARAVMAKPPEPAQFDDRLQMRAVKAWIDGALGSRGAALLTDYSDQPGHRGLMLYSAAQLKPLAELTAAHGWQLNVHAIGDAGNRTVLDVLQQSMTPQQRQALRPRIEHAQVVALNDLPRFAQLGVIASIQPTHATSDKNMAEARIGPERIKGAYAWRKLLDAKARLAGGSDFPVELPNPFHGLYAAVTRRDRAGQPPGGWYGDEKLTREEALRLFTVDAAYAAHMETKVGSLEPGKWADFILISQDYFKVSEDAIDDIQVLGTYVAGKKVAPTGARTAAR